MNSIQLFGVSGTDVTFAPDANTLRESALAAGALIARVDSSESNAAADAAMKGLKSLMSDVEKTREIVKQPHLEKCRLIDKAAREFISDVSDEFRRLQRATADWQTAQLERVKEQERRRQEEMRRIDINEPGISDEERQRREQDAMTLQPVAPTTVKGQTVREEWGWEVTDIYALVRAHPACVKIEPRAAEIKALLSVLPIDPVKETPVVAGLRVFSQVKVNTRAVRGRTIDT